MPSGSASWPGGRCSRRWRSWRPCTPPRPPRPRGRRRSGRVASSSYPTNAAKIFRWGNAQWHDEFVTPLTSMWRVNQPRQVRDQHGMLTLDATPRGGSVVATLTGSQPALRTLGGARARRASTASSGTPYHAASGSWCPTYGGYHCGARNLVLSDYRLGSNQAHDARAQHSRPPTSPPASRSPLSDNAVPHLRRRGHPRPRLVVRRHARDHDRAPARGPLGRRVHRPVPARRPAPARR